MIEIIIGLLILAFIFSFFGLIFIAFLSLDIGYILLLIGIGIFVFNVIYYYLNKTDTSNQYEKLPPGIVCPNCGSNLSSNGNFCSNCGYRREPS